MDKEINLTGNGHRHQSNIIDTANDLVKDGKKLAGEVLDEGKNKIHEAQDNVKLYSHEIIEKVQANPLKALLIAGGVGFILAAILKR